MSTRRAGALCLTFVALAAAFSPRPVAASDYGTYRQDYAGEEATRLINGERAFHGLPRLATDKVLATKARDGAIACPNATSKVMLGRARDIATSGVFSHGLELCGRNADGSYRYSVVDAMYAWGYNTYRGEILAWNTYPVTAAVYHYGCALDGSGCSRSRTTVTPAYVAAAMSGWMRSGPHRALVLGTYDRVGCGSWESSTGVRYFSCLFSLGGPNPREVTRPTVSSVTGRGTTVSGVVSFYATVADDFRLSDGWAKLDGRVVSAFAFSLDVRSARPSVTIDTRRLANGQHTLVWRARDVASLKSTLTSGTVSFTVRNP